MVGVVNKHQANIKYQRRETTAEQRSTKPACPAGEAFFAYKSHKYS
jgi:hypothetical protein